MFPSASSAPDGSLKPEVHFPIADNRDQPIHADTTDRDTFNLIRIDKLAGQRAALDRNQVIVQYMALYDMAAHDIYGIFTPN